LNLFLLTRHALPASAGITARQKADTDVLRWIEPLIGSKSGGNVFAGATLPYGMAKGRKPDPSFFQILTKPQLLRT
jgi:hypothetical protein